MALQKGAKVEHTELPAWRKELRILSRVRFPRRQVSLVRLILQDLRLLKEEKEIKNGVKNGDLFRNVR